MAANKRKFYETPEFKKLNATWKKKLEKSGFEDKEQDENRMKNWDSSVQLRYDHHKFESIEEYYRQAGWFLNEHEFPSKWHQKIWEMHANGATIEETSRVMKSCKFKVHNKTAIYRELKKLTQEMLKTYAN